MGQRIKTMAWLHTAVAALLLAAGMPAWAVMHKCTQADGRITYQDKPCDNG